MTDFYNNHNDSKWNIPHNLFWAIIIVAICIPIIASIAVNYEYLSTVIIAYVQQIIPDGIWFLHVSQKYISSI